jgi:hypothetical protein
MVGAIGFEPTTPCAQGRCATRLRYAPTLLPKSILKHTGSLFHSAAFACLPCVRASTQRHRELDYARCRKPEHRRAIFDFHRCR